MSLHNLIHTCLGEEKQSVNKCPHLFACTLRMCRVKVPGMQEVFQAHMKTYNAVAFGLAGALLGQGHTEARHASLLNLAPLFHKLAGPQNKPFDLVQVTGPRT